MKRVVSITLAAMLVCSGWSHAAPAGPAPTDSPRAVLEKFVAAAKKDDIEGCLSLATGSWKEDLIQMLRRRPGELQRDFGQHDIQTAGERIGEKDEAGKAWLEVIVDDGRERVTLEFDLDLKTNRWLISGTLRNGQNQHTLNENMEKLGRIRGALKMWADDHGGSLPDNLASLKPKYIRSDEIPVWTNPRTGKQTPFIYCPGLTLGDPGKIVAAAPEPGNGFRLVALADGSVSRVSEDQFQMTARAQGWRWLAARKEGIPREEQQRIRAVVQRLASNEFRVRSEAKAELKAMGAEATPILQEFIDAPDPEVRATVRELLGVR